MSTLLRAAATLAVAGTAHAAVNARLLLRAPAPADAPPDEPVAVLLPVRDEAARVAACVAALAVAARSYTAVTGCPAQLLVLDDGSTDATAALAAAAVAGAPGGALLTGAPPPPGWLGKPWACHQLATAADPAARVLVFVDADVLLAPDGLLRTVALLRQAGLDLVSPYPRQLAAGAVPRLLQPLLQWSWLTLLPLRAALRPGRPSLAAANGQLLAVDRRAYEECGGHGAVRASVLEDLELLRALKRRGFRGGVADGTDLATCRMYDDGRAALAGYRKSLWAAAGGGERGRPVASAAQVALLTGVYVVPAVAALRGSRAGWLGYAAGVAGRVVTGRRTGARVLPDAAAHPLGVAVLAVLTAGSWWGRTRGTLRWKGRAVVAGARP